MSGIEIAGLAFGVLPLLVEAVKSYSTISKKTHTLRHYSKEIKSISEQLKVHRGIFLNEVRLLLRSVTSEEEVESMLEDAVDQRWTKTYLDNKIRMVLQDSFEVCRGIIEETGDILDTMRGEMAKFDELLAQRTKGESFKSALKRLGGAFKITFNKSQYDSCLANLRDRNGDLKTLRSQVSTFQRQDYQKRGSGIQNKALPNGIGLIQNASHKLHEALCGAWCCDDPAHRGHDAKLCIDAQVQAEVRLDLAISCYEPCLNGKTSASQGVYEQQPNDTASSNGSDMPKPLEAMTSCAVNVLKKKASSNLQQQSSSRKKVKRVHFIDPPIVSVPVAKLPDFPPRALAPDINLDQEKNICKYLQKHRVSGKGVAQRCIGYLESPQMYKHRFYFRNEEAASGRTPLETQSNNVYSVFDVMRHDADEALLVEDQLRLALKTALALLQFNDTPWLADRWRLRDLSYFGTGHTLDQTALKTLHLSSQISAPVPAAAINNAMDGVERVSDTVSDQVRYGINNTTLFFLGVALLEIAHWEPIEEKMTARDLNNEVFAARRLAAGRAPLGPQYQKIAEKCLQCNFGFGTKLSNKGLQTAVYNDVICELEDMIEQLSI
ncbi:hypothetical protein OPT61_g3796 [Boeremia exigua]|uniref:Uncharacterized protein n=1 Tax=Boeremia exigua TaxID=749465 RepID=A0ACC2IGK9_9PLEO|nr:hypothetical protein OPT61_g3796 [Boeremia exigua]